MSRSQRKWKRPSAWKIRREAKALGIEEWRTAPVDDLYRAINQFLLGQMMWAGKGLMRDREEVPCG